MWDDYFEKRRPSPENVRTVVLKLNEARKHEHVIAVIEAAIRHDQLQPWMFPVLATSMKIVGRPQEDVERVLLSQVDYGGTDVVSMLYSAAYLTRFGALRQALDLYRQASQLGPTRPEPYVLSLKLARQLKDYEAVGWAAEGILINAWTQDYRQLHSDAVNAIRDSMQELNEAGQAEAANKLQEQLQAALQRDLVLRLTWSGDGDVDLIVEEPLGTICSAIRPQTAGGGVLVHDGAGPEAKDSHDDYVCALAAPGYYRIRVRHMWGEIVGKRARLEVIRYQGTDHETRRNFTVLLGREDAIVRVAVKHGRRTDRLEIPEPLEGSESTEVRRKPRGSLRQRIGNVPGMASAGNRLQNSRAFRGGGAVGFQPNIALLDEGVTLRAQAVISGDRRYVRLSLQPVFNSITDVFTFSFINSGATGGTQGGGGTGIRAGGNGVPGGGINSN